MERHERKESHSRIKELKIGKRLDGKMHVLGDGWINGTREAKREDRKWVTKRERGVKPEWGEPHV